MTEDYQAWKQDMDKKVGSKTNEFINYNTGH